MLKFVFYRLLAVLISVILINSTASQSTADNIHLDISGYLYIYHLHITFIVKDGRSFPIEIDPKVVLEIKAGSDIYGKTATIEIDIFNRDGKKLFQNHINDVVIDSEFVMEFGIPPKIIDAEYAKVRFILEKEIIRKRIEFINYRLDGRVTDFSGQQLKGRSFVILETGFDEFIAGVETNDEGYYEIIVPARRYHTIWAVDENFGHTSLERYAHHVHIDRDLSIDFRIGQMELYRLTAAVTAERTVLADFSIFSVHHFIDRIIAIQEKADEPLRMLEVVADSNFYPHIMKEDVEMFVNGKPVDVWTVERRLSSLKLYGDENLARPYWIVEGALPDDIGPGRHTLKVVVSSQTNINDRFIVEKGEASYHDLSVW